MIHFNKYILLIINEIYYYYYGDHYDHYQYKHLRILFK